MGKLSEALERGLSEAFTFDSDFARVGFVERS